MGTTDVDAVTGRPNKIVRRKPNAIVTAIQPATRATRLPQLKNCKPIAVFIAT